MPLSTIDLVRFESYGREVVRLMNTIYETDMYTIDHVEVIQSLKDFKDGKGLQLESCAAVRNPVDTAYDMYLNLLGTSEEAMELLVQTLQKLLDSGAIKIKETKPTLLN